MNNHSPLSTKKSRKKKPERSDFLRSLFLWIFIALFIISLFNLASQTFLGPVKQLKYTEFYKLLEANTVKPSIKSIKKIENLLEGEFTPEAGGGRFMLYVPSEDKDLVTLLRKNVADFEVEPPRTLWSNILYSLGPMILFILFLWYFAYRGNQMGNRIWSFGKVRTKMNDKDDKVKITFLDVAGVDEAKEELTEVIEFLRDPKRFQRLGGKIPKGVLLVGPPGCGKTLLAKAVAGEANVPFFSISGSDFVELFVGVGASRVRDLFEQAKKASKVSGRGAIIFIDEIDAVGRQRFAGIGGGHDEREQTLNQLLVEMDGFDSTGGVIIVAATNRPDVLDPALLRPGRFDRHVVIDRPDIKGREEILNVHVKNLKLAPDVNLNSIARQTPGFSGADLANLTNEAALLAARREKQAVEMPELQEAIERVLAGPERKSRVISKREKEIVALHEAGHSLLSLLLPNVDPLHKVSIIPRGVAALGYTMQLPSQDKYLTSRSELFSRLVVLLGGRAAEEMILGEVTTGAHNDLEVASKTARQMVTEFGMSERLGHISLGKREDMVFLGRDLGEQRNYSEETARLIDEEVNRIVQGAYSQAVNMLKKNEDKLMKLGSTLLEKEVLTSSEVRTLLDLPESIKKEESVFNHTSKENDSSAPTKISPLDLV